MTGTVDRRSSSPRPPHRRRRGRRRVGGEVLFGRTSAEHRRPASGMTAPGMTAPAARLARCRAEDRPAEAAARDERRTASPGYPRSSRRTRVHRVDTSLVLPKVSPANWKPRIDGMVDRPMTLTYDDLIKMPMIDGTSR